MARNRTLDVAGAIVLVVCVGVSTSNAQSSLIAAIKANDVATVRALLDQRTDVNAVQADGTTALHWAAEGDAAEIVQLLIRAGANVTATNRYGATPLWLPLLHRHARRA